MLYFYRGVGGSRKSIFNNIKYIIYIREIKDMKTIVSIVIVTIMTFILGIAYYIQQAISR